MFDYLSPRSLATPQEVVEYLELQQAAQDFRLEVEHRARLEAYYQWYDQTAAENQRDLEQMRSEINLLTWFRVFQLNTYSEVHRDRPNGPNSRPKTGWFF